MLSAWSPHVLVYYDILQNAASELREEDKHYEVTKHELHFNPS